MEEIINKYAALNDLNVSRETCTDFESFISMIIEKNNQINIIRKKSLVMTLSSFSFLVPSQTAYKSEKIF